MRVLVTRPQPGAARTARKLAALGHEAVELPLTEVVGMEDELRHAWRPSATPEVPNPEGERRRKGATTSSTAIAITSANAIRHTPAALLRSLRHLPCHVVGGETAAHARAVGFSDVREGPGTAEGLAEQISRNAEQDAAITYLCGRIRLDAFENLLIKAGFLVHAVETYDTRPLAYAADDLSRLLGAEPIGAVLLYSAGAAEQFLVMAGLEKAAGNAILLCMSPRVADRLAGVDASRIKVAGAPTEAALLALL